MNRRTIVSIAGACGVAAFAWALIAQAPPPGPVVLRPTGREPMPPDFLPVDIDGLRELVKREPGNYRAWMQLAVVLRDEDRPEEAAEAWARTLEAARQAEAMDRLPRVFFAEMWAQYQLGHPDLAAILAYHANEVYSTPEMMERIVRNDGMLYRLGWIRAMRGQMDQARSAWADAARLVEVGQARGLGPDRAYLLAGYRALAGETLGALEALKQAQTLGYRNYKHALHDEALEPIRGEAEFGRVIQLMREAAAAGDGDRRVR